MFSNYCRTFLILIILNFQVSQAWPQERSVYRVEVLVLRHLDHSEPLEYSLALQPPSEDALDFLPSAPSGANNADPIFPWQADTGLLPPIGPFPEPDPFEDVVALAERSERMSTVWRNLRLSESFRPEAFLAWEQPVDPPFPLIRVHNETVIHIEDPYQNIRAMPVPPFTWNPGEGRLETMRVPDPELHYALEGTVRLRRSRFLHFELDLSLRTPPAADGFGSPGPPLDVENIGYGIVSMAQSRQVRTGRMEYFDSPALGALVWITEVEYTDELMAEDTAAP